jgi:Ser/Thr protein kinase RdoA (MazF antagonist)
VVLRCYEIRDAAHADFETSLLEHLHARGFPSPRPIRNRRHTLVGSFNGKPYTVLELLEGIHVAEPEEAQLIEVVRAVARLHILTADLRLTNWEVVGAHTVDKCLHVAEKAAAAHADRTKAKLRLMWLRQELAALVLPDDVAKGVCHCDFHYTNMLFESGRFSWLIDFDDACYTHLICDIANFIDYWSPPYRGIDDVTRTRRFLAEYEDVRPLSDLERLHIYDALKLQILLDSVWYFGRGDDDTFVEKKKVDALNALGRDGFHDLLW